MWRRKGRTFLTVFGIVVGIFALTVLGGLSARLNQQVSGSKAWFTSRITVVPEGGSLFGGRGFFERSKADEIGRIEGVKAAVVGLGLPIEDNAGIGFGPPELIIGYDLEYAEDLFKVLKLANGRILSGDEEREILLGSNLAEKLSTQSGESIVLRDEKFSVVGTLEPTLSAPDDFAFISYEESLELYKKANPLFEVDEIAATIEVLPKENTDAEALARLLESSITGIRAISPNEAEQQISQISFIFTAILLGSALIALIVGGLSIINTMIMSVSERTKEIGLKKAIGADTKSILGEYLFEAALIGLFGGMIGVIGGVGIISAVNSATSANQVTIFAITPTVLIGPVLFAVVLGTAAGFFPALRAARLKPIEALKQD